MITLVTPPSAEPISLQEAREHCRIDATAEDALLDGYIAAARQHLEAVTGRAFISQTWALSLDRWPCWIDIPRPPLASVSAITYVDTNGATQTLASNQYRVSSPSGPTCARGRITPAYAVTWPSVRRQSNAITVTFSAGYGQTGDTVPAPIRQALLLLVGHWYENREAVIVSGSTSAAIELPMGVKTLIAPFKTWEVAA